MITITVIALICAAVILVLRSALSIVHVVVLPTLPVVLGCWLLVSEERAQTMTAVWLTVALTALVIAYFAARPLFIQSDGPRLRLEGDNSRQYVTILVAITSLFTLYHFAKGGIPILSNNVETSRFEFGNSGLFGIPGRMYLFGLPLATGAALARSRQLGLTWYRDRLTVIAIATFTVSRLLSGFKGGLLEVLITLMAAAVLAQGPVTSVARVLQRYLPLVLAAVIGVFTVGSLYSSYRTQGRSLPNAILARATTNAALPGVLVFEKRLQFVPNSSIDVDTRYFARKYFSIGAPSPYSFGRLVASTIFHIAPESGAYTAPVTYGSTAELAYDFGLPIALVLMCGIGILLALLESLARRSTLSGYVICLAGVLATYDFVNKGGLAYMCINWTLMTGLLLVATRGFLILAPHRRVRSKGRRPTLGGEHKQISMVNHPPLG